MEAVTGIRQEDCARVEEVDTTFNGVMDAATELVQKAMTLCRTKVGYNDPAFAGELLLLAGLCMLRTADGDTPQNSCVHFVNLTKGGEAMPPQSVFVVLTDAERRATSQTSPVKNLRLTSNIPNQEDIEREEPHPEVESLFSSIPANPTTEAELEAQAEEYLQARLADKPSAASEGLRLPKHLMVGRMIAPRRGALQAGLTASRN